MVELHLLAYSKEQHEYRALTVEGVFPVVSRTLQDQTWPLAASRVIAHHVLNLTFSEEEWYSMAYKNNSDFRELLKHVTYYYVFYDNFIIIPTPGVNYSGVLQNHQIPLTLLEDSYTIAGDSVFPLTSNTQPTSFAKHDNPDFILLNMKDYEPWPGLSEALYIGYLKRCADKWNVYYPPQGDLPDISQMTNLKGILINGARYNMTDDSLEWKNEFLEFIRYAYTTSVKLVGICLGHQALAVALGGKVGKNKTNKFINKAEYCRRITDSEVLNRDFMIAQVHGECVLTPIQEALILHTSETAEYEVCYIPNKLLSMQGHPEYNSHFMASFYRKDPSIDLDSDYVIDEINKFLHN